MNIEIIGIIASLVVTLSFLYTNEKTIRKINLIGSILFVIYGICIKSISVVLLNTILIIIHIKRIIKR